VAQYCALSSRLGEAAASQASLAIAQAIMAAIRSSTGIGTEARTDQAMLDAGRALAEARRSLVLVIRLRLHATAHGHAARAAGPPA
jgi:hypothetical protein